MNGRALGSPQQEATLLEACAAVSGDTLHTSYAGKWVTVFEKAAYRGG